MKYSILILLFAIFSIDAKHIPVYDLDISGTWEHSIFPNFVNIYSRSSSPVDLVCRDELSKNCRDSLERTDYTFTIDFETMEFSRAGIGHSRMSNLVIQ